MIGKEILVKDDKPASIDGKTTELLHKHKRLNRQRTTPAAQCSIFVSAGSNQRSIKALKIDKNRQNHRAFERCSLYKVMCVWLTVIPMNDGLSVLLTTTSLNICHKFITKVDNVIPQCWVSSFVILCSLKHAVKTKSKKRQCWFRYVRLHVMTVTDHGNVYIN